MRPISVERFQALILACVGQRISNERDATLVLLSHTKVNGPSEEGDIFPLGGAIVKGGVNDETNYTNLVCKTTLTIRETPIQPCLTFLILNLEERLHVHGKWALAFSRVPYRERGTLRAVDKDAIECLNTLNRL